MSYTPTIWVTGDEITAAKLNNEEQGMKANDDAVAALGIKVPDAPTASGRYKLTAKITSGTPAYSWKYSGMAIAPWSTGSDEEIVAMIQAAHNGDINLQTDGGWAIGDVRTITISAFTAGGNVAVPQQDVDLVISSFDDYMECGCVMQFDFKDALSVGTKMNLGTASSTGSYGATNMKQVTLPSLVNALPTYLKNMLIEFSCLAHAAQGASDVYTVTGNKLALRSEIEIFGERTWSGSGEGSQIPYYMTAANRIKSIGKGESAGRWWERSPYWNDFQTFCVVKDDGTAYESLANASNGVSPFGCL